MKTYNKEELSGKSLEELHAIADELGISYSGHDEKEATPLMYDILDKSAAMAAAERVSGEKPARKRQRVKPVDHVYSATQLKAKKIEKATMMPSERSLFGDLSDEDREILAAPLIMESPSNVQPTKTEAEPTEATETPETETEMTEDIVEETPKRRRGRPKKVKDEAAETVETTAEITTAPPVSTVSPNYFAIDQKWDSGITETVNAGYTDQRGYLNLDNTLGSSVEFTVNVPVSGNYMTHIRFANGSATDRKMKLFVNGNTQNYWLQSFTTTGDWTVWNEFGIVLPLVSGSNTIKFESATSEGGPNLDYINLILTDEPFAETYDPSQEQQPTVSGNHTLYIAGDSTAQSYRASYAPQQGWGYYVSDFFNDSITVSNQSIAGRSSKKFYDEGRWKTIADSLKDGDFVLIQFFVIHFQNFRELFGYVFDVTRVAVPLSISFGVFEVFRVVCLCIPFAIFLGSLNDFFFGGRNITGHRNIFIIRRKNIG